VPRLYAIYTTVSLQLPHTAPATAGRLPWEGRVLDEYSNNDQRVLKSELISDFRIHCEEQSDEAIPFMSPNALVIAKHAVPKQSPGIHFRIHCFVAALLALNC